MFLPEDENEDDENPVKTISTAIHNMANPFSAAANSFSFWENSLRKILDRVLPSIFEEKTKDNSLGGYDIETGANGSIILKNLSLKVDVINNLMSQKNVKLVYGCIGKLEISIPFYYLTVMCHLPGGLFSDAGIDSDKIEIKIDDAVFLLVPDSLLSRDINMERNEKMKLDFLQAMELFIENTSGFKFPAIHSILSNLITACLKKFHFSVSNVHVRYEDRQSVQVPNKQDKKVDKVGEHSRGNHHHHYQQQQQKQQQKNIRSLNILSPAPQESSSPIDPNNRSGTSRSSASGGGIRGSGRREIADNEGETNSISTKETKWAKFACGFTLQHLNFETLPSDERISSFNLSVDIDKDKVEFEHFFDSRDEDEGNSKKVCIKKSLDVKQFSVYWNPILYENSEDDKFNRFLAHKSFVPTKVSKLLSNSKKRRVGLKVFNDLKNSIPRANNDVGNPKHHFILLPMDMDMLMAMTYGENFKHFKVNAKIVIPHLNIAIEDRQLREMIEFKINMKRLNWHQAYYFHRPKETIDFNSSMVMQGKDEYEGISEYIRSCKLFDPMDIIAIKEKAGDEKIKALLEYIRKCKLIDFARFAWKQKLLEVKDSKFDLYTIRKENASPIPPPSSLASHLATLHESENGGIQLPFSPKLDLKVRKYMSRGAKFKYFFDQFSAFKAVYTELWKFKIRNSDLNKKSSQMKAEDKRNFIMLSKTKALIKALPFGINEELPKLWKLSPLDLEQKKKQSEFKDCAKEIEGLQEFDSFGTMAWMMQDQLLPAHSCSFRRTFDPFSNSENSENIRSAVDLFHALREAKQAVTVANYRKLENEAEIRKLLVKQWLCQLKFQDLETLRVDYCKQYELVRLKAVSDDEFCKIFAKKFHKHLCDTLVKEHRYLDSNYYNNLWARFQRETPSSPSGVILNKSIFIKALVDIFIIAAGANLNFSEAFEALDASDVSKAIDKEEGNLKLVNKDIEKATSDVFSVLPFAKIDRDKRAQLDQSIVNLLDIIEFYIPRAEDIYSLRALARDDLVISKSSGMLSQLWSHLAGTGGTSNIAGGGGGAAANAPLAELKIYQGRLLDTKHLFRNFDIIPKSDLFDQWRFNIQKLKRMADVSIIQTTISMGLSYEVQNLKDGISYNANMNFIPFFKINTFCTYLSASKIIHESPIEKYRFSVFDIEVFDMSKYQSVDKRIVFRKNLYEPNFDPDTRPNPSRVSWGASKDKMNKVKNEGNSRGSGGKWYPGKISRDNRGDMTYDIVYDDGESEMRVPEDMIRSRDAHASTSATTSAATVKRGFQEGDSVERCFDYGRDFVLEYMRTRNADTLSDLSEIIRNNRNKLSDGNFFSLEVVGNVFQDEEDKFSIDRIESIESSSLKGPQILDKVKVYQADSSDKSAIITHDYGNGVYKISYQDKITTELSVSMETIEILVDVNILWGRSNLKDFMVAFDPRTPLFFYDAEGEFENITENQYKSRVKQAKMEKKKKEINLVYKKINIDLPILVVCSKEVYFDDSANDADFVVVKLGKASYKEEEDDTSQIVSIPICSRGEEIYNVAETISLGDFEEKVVESLFKKDDYFNPIKLAITDIKIFIISKKKWKIKDESRSDGNGSIDTTTLVENYKVEVKVEMKVLAWEYSAPWMKLFITAPDPININLSNSKVKKLLEITYPRPLMPAYQSESGLTASKDKYQAKKSPPGSPKSKLSKTENFSQSDVQFHVSTIEVLHFEEEDSSSEDLYAEETGDYSNYSGSPDDYDSGDDDNLSFKSIDENESISSDSDELQFEDAFDVESLLKSIESLTNQINDLVVKIRANEKDADYNQQNDMNEINDLKDQRSEKYSILLDYKMSNFSTRKRSESLESLRSESTRISSRSALSSFTDVSFDNNSNSNSNTSSNRSDSRTQEDIAKALLESFYDQAKSNVKKSIKLKEDVYFSATIEKLVVSYENDNSDESDSSPIIQSHNPTLKLVLNKMQTKLLHRQGNVQTIAMTSLGNFCVKYEKYKVNEREKIVKVFASSNKSDFILQDEPVVFVSDIKKSEKSEVNNVKMMGVAARRDFLELKFMIDGSTPFKEKKCFLNLNYFGMCMEALLLDEVKAVAETPKSLSIKHCESLQNDADAQYYLARCYIEEDVYEDKFEAGLEHLMLVYDEDYQNFLASALKDRKYEEGLSHLIQSAHLNHPEANLLLAKLFENLKEKTEDAIFRFPNIDEIIEELYKQVEEGYDKLEAFGNPKKNKNAQLKAQFELSKLLMPDLLNYQEEGLDKLRKSSDNNYLPAQYRLGQYYQYNKLDFEQAIELYVRGAKKGDSDCKDKLQKDFGINIQDARSDFVFNLNKSEDIDKGFYVSLFLMHNKEFNYSLDLESLQLSYDKTCTTSWFLSPDSEESTEDLFSCCWRDDEDNVFDLKMEKVFDIADDNWKYYLIVDQNNDDANVSEDKHYRNSYQKKLVGSWPFSVQVTVTKEGYEVFFDESHHHVFEHQVEFNNKLTIKSSPDWAVKPIPKDRFRRLLGDEVKNEWSKIEDPDPPHINPKRLQELITCETSFLSCDSSLSMSLLNLKLNRFYPSNEADEHFVELKQAGGNYSVQTFYGRKSEGFNGDPQPSFSINLKMQSFIINHEVTEAIESREPQEEEERRFCAFLSRNGIDISRMDCPMLLDMKGEPYKASFCSTYPHIKRAMRNSIELYKTFNDYRNIDECLVKLAYSHFVLTPAMIKDAKRMISLFQKETKPSLQGKSVSKMSSLGKSISANLIGIDNDLFLELFSSDRHFKSSPLVQLARKIKDFDDLIYQSKCYFKVNGKVCIECAGLDIEVLPTDKDPKSLVLQCGKAVVSLELGNFLSEGGHGCSLDFEINQCKTLIKFVENDCSTSLSLVEFNSLHLKLVASLSQFKNMANYHEIIPKFHSNSSRPYSESKYAENFYVYFLLSPVSINFMSDRRMRNLGTWLAVSLDTLLSINFPELAGLTLIDKLSEISRGRNVKEASPKHETSNPNPILMNNSNSDKDDSIYHHRLPLRRLETDEFGRVGGEKGCNNILDGPPLYKINLAFDELRFNIDSRDSRDSELIPLFNFSLLGTSLEVKNEYTNNEPKEEVIIATAAIVFKESTYADSVQYIVKTNGNSNFFRLSLLLQLDENHLHYHAFVGLNVTNVQLASSYKSIFNLVTHSLLLSEALWSGMIKSSKSPFLFADDRLNDIQTQIRDLTELMKRNKASGVNSSKISLGTSIDDLRVKSHPISNPLSTSQESVADLAVKEASLLFRPMKSSFFSNVKKLKVKCNFEDNGVWIPLDDKIEKNDCNALIISANSICNFELELKLEKISASDLSIIRFEISEIKIELAKIDCRELELYRNLNTDFEEGDKVLCRKVFVDDELVERCLWHPGKISFDHGDKKTYNIAYDDGEIEEDVHELRIRPRQKHIIEPFSILYPNPEPVLADRPHSVRISLIQVNVYMTLNQLFVRFFEGLEDTNKAYRLVWNNSFKSFFDAANALKEEMSKKQLAAAKAAKEAAAKEAEKVLAALGPLKRQAAAISHGKFNYIDSWFPEFSLLLLNGKIELDLEFEGMSVTICNDIFKYTFPLLEVKLKEHKWSINKEDNKELYVSKLFLPEPRFPSKTPSKRASMDPFSEKSRRASMGMSTILQHSLHGYSTVRMSRERKEYRHDNKCNTVSIFTSLGFEVNYFNQVLMSWEPLFDHTVIDIEFTKPINAKVIYQFLRGESDRRVTRKEFEKVYDKEGDNLFNEAGLQSSSTQGDGLSQVYSSSPPFVRIPTTPSTYRRNSSMTPFILPNTAVKDKQLEDNERERDNVKQKFSLKFKKSINLNITIPLLEMVSHCIDCMKSTEESVNVFDSSNRKEDLSVIVVRNNSGMDLEYDTWYSKNASIVREGHKDQVFTVKAGENEKLQLNYGELYNNRLKNVNIRLIGKSNKLECGIDSSYSQIRAIESQGNETSNHHHYSKARASLERERKTFVKVDMATDRGLRTLTVSSLVKIVNNSSMVLNVKLVFAKLYESQQPDQHSWLNEGIDIPIAGTVHLPVIFCRTLIDQGCKLEVVPKLASSAATYTDFSREDGTNDLSSVQLSIKVPKFQNDSGNGNSDIDDYEDVETNQMVDLQNAVESFNVHWRRCKIEKEDVDYSAATETDLRSKLDKCNSLIWKNPKASTRDHARSYAQWLSFGFSNSKRIGVNLTSHVNAYSNDSSSSSVSSKVYPTEIIFGSPIRLINELACSINIKFFRESEISSVFKVENRSDIFKDTLLPTDEFKCADIHSLEKFCMVLSINSNYGSLVYIPGHDISKGLIYLHKTADGKDLSTDVMFPNGSVLKVNFEVEFSNGERIIRAYTPVWIVSSSVFDLEYQHDINRIDASKRNEAVNLNGSRDDLAAAQLSLTSQLHERSEFANYVDQFHISDFREHNSARPKIRGVHGVIIGPKTRSNGLLDEIIDQEGIKRNTGFPFMFTGVPSRKNEEEDDNGDDNGDIISTRGHSRSNSNAVNKIINAEINADNSCSIIQCGFTDAQYKKLYMKMRACGSAWSHSFSIEDSEIRVNSKREYDMTNEEKVVYSRLNDTISRPLLRKGNQIFPFTIKAVKPDPKSNPFPRTRIFVISDKISVNNTTNYSFEMRQVIENVNDANDVNDVDDGDDSYQKFPPMSSRPLWWRPGSQSLQVRICSEQEHGWNWSGAFSINTDNEIYLRLRNNQVTSSSSSSSGGGNNSGKEVIFFAMIKVHIVDSKVSVTIHGNNTLAPYKIENHSSYNFRLKQKGADSRSTTNLLPCEYALYAWDEPLISPQLLDIERENLNKAGTWNSIGQPFNFDENKEIILKDNLRVRVISEGPTKVMQIFQTSKPLTSSIIKKEDIKKDYGRLPVNLHLMLEIEDLIVNLLDINKVEEVREDLLLSRLENIKVDVKIGEKFIICKVNIAGFQIDNQTIEQKYSSNHDGKLGEDSSSSPIYECLLQSGISSPDSDSIEKSPTEFEIIVDKTYAPGLLYLPLLCISVSPFSLNLEGNFLVRLLKYGEKCAKLFPNAKGTLSSKMKQNVNEYIFAAHKDFFQSQVSSPTSTSTDTGVKFIKHFEISDLKIGLSTNFFVEYAILTDLFLQYLALTDYWMLRSITRICYSFFSLLSKLDNCPLHFPGMSINNRWNNSKDNFANPFQSEEFLLYNLKNHYVSKYQISPTISFPSGPVKLLASVVGSLEVIGNPLGFYKSIQNGMDDFFESLPLVKASKVHKDVLYSGGIVRYLVTYARYGVGSFCKSLSNMDATKQLIRGSVSLLKCVLVSVSNSLVHIASAMQLGLLTMGIVNNKFIRRRPLNLIQGLQLALKGLYIDPIYGFRNSGGLKGLIFGLFRGAFGLFSRPLFGMLERTSELLSSFSHLLIPRISQIKKGSALVDFNLSQLTIRQETNDRTIRSSPPDSMITYRRNQTITISSSGGGSSGGSGGKRGRFRPSRDSKQNELRVPLQVYTLEPICGKTVFNLLDKYNFLKRSPSENETYENHYLLYHGQMLILTSRQILVLSELSEKSNPAAESSSRSINTPTDTDIDMESKPSPVILFPETHDDNSNCKGDDEVDSNSRATPKSGFICEWRCFIDDISYIEDKENKEKRERFPSLQQEVNKILVDKDFTFSSSASSSNYSSPSASPYRNRSHIESSSLLLGNSAYNLTSSSEGFTKSSALGSAFNTGGQYNGSSPNESAKKGNSYVSSHGSMSGSKHRSRTTICITTKNDNLTHELVFPSDKTSFNFLEYIRHSRNKTRTDI